MNSVPTGHVVLNLTGDRDGGIHRDPIAEGNLKISQIVLVNLQKREKNNCLSWFKK